MFHILTSYFKFNTFRPGDAHQWNGSSLVQVMTCHLFSTKPLPEPMLTTCQLDRQWHFNQNMKFLLNENAFEIIICKMVAILFWSQCFTGNSLPPSVAIWRHRSGSILAQCGMLLRLISQEKLINLIGNICSEITQSKRTSHRARNSQSPGSQMLWEMQKGYNMSSIYVARLAIKNLGWNNRISFKWCQLVKCKYR